MTTTSLPVLGTVLLLGGSGFLGQHVAQAFLQEPSCNAIHVVSRKVPRVTVDSPKIEYHQGDVTDLAAMQKLIADINPRVICNLAYPGDLAKPQVLKSVIIDGTSNIIKCATDNDSVKAMVYTATQHVVRMDPGEILTEETAHVWTSADNANPYSLNKALAETLVLKANGVSLKTASIRVPGLYGEGHNVIIDGQIKRLRKGEHHIQVGGNKRLFEFIYAPSAASAHVLAAKCLLATGSGGKVPKVEGEAFFVSDDEPRLFWDFVSDVLAAAGHQLVGEKIKVVPFWLVILMASLSEWAYKIFTLGTKEPALRVSDIKFLQEGSRFSISKAKERLGYKPLLSQREGIKRSVTWALEHEDEKFELKRQ